MSKYGVQLLLWLLIVVALCLLFGGCALFRKAGPTVTLGNAHVEAPTQVGKPATIEQSDAKSDFTVPAGSVIRIVERPATPTTPASRVTEWTLKGDTKFESFDTTTKAQSGTTDNTQALHAQDLKSKEPLLYAALACVLGAALFVYLKYPTPAVLCGIAGGVFFAAWKLADLPPWMWGAGAVAAAGGVFLYFGHEKGLSTATATPPKA